MKIAGIDEAGRGPVIGPMVIAGIALKEDEILRINELNVKDSKKISPKKREKLFEEILKIAKYHIEIIDAETIDRERKYRSLNDIEIDSMARIIEKLKPNIVQIGSPDINSKRFIDKLTMRVGKIQILSIHNAEDVFPMVAAASIVAKVTRDRIIAKLREEYGDFGSGYPSDPKTRLFIMNSIKRKEIPNIIRRSWKTFTKLNLI
ncbi:MAG: ribonuclease HII [Candidatus Methanomethyliaceae archaeon]|nr:ribonuclease HII [Candidatus Methanomethyliaceae archaeon]MCX8170257.1 ribonuclease HII [Candidatus Methanomethyliaceae archaeon]MDW7970901.1 ribonuclease HII [Nitrososphaerota archaeon]